MDGLSPAAETCPGCGVAPSMWLRDVLPPGFELHGGRYRLHHPLGKGGFGVTYLGEHLQLNAPVAIKEFFPQEQALRNSETRGLSVPTHGRDAFLRALARFLEEGRILARLRHPGVVRVSDLFEERGTAYLVMDLVEGGTLREELERAPEGRLEESRVRQLTEQMVEALHAVHMAGVCHLDIKPENVLLTEDSQPVLVDFGSARYHFGTETRTRTSSPYTEAYAAPELFGGKPGEPATDLYELGVMVHEMLTGTLPPSAVSRLMDLEGGWRLAVEMEPWRGLLESALSFRPEQRPRSVREWWEGAMRNPAARPTPYHSRSLAHSQDSPSVPADREEAQAVVLQIRSTTAGQVVTPPAAGLRSAPPVGPSAPHAAPPAGLVAMPPNPQGRERFRVEGVGSVLVAVPAGRFWMGSPGREEGRCDNEVQHEVVLSRGFLLGEAVVTSAEYGAVMGGKPSGSNGPDRPAVKVSWLDAVGFCNALSRRSGLEEAYMVSGGRVTWKGLSSPGFRLPTEAEWEYACRAGTTGARYGDLEAVAWYDGNSGGGTHAVRQKQPNAWGLYDTLGNVWEWCWDWYGGYPQGVVQDPLGPGSGLVRMARGGSWGDGARFARAACRYDLDPTDRFGDLGFRLARSLP